MTLKKKILYLITLTILYIGWVVLIPKNIEPKEFMYFGIISMGLIYGSLIIDIIKEKKK